MAPSTMANWAPYVGISIFVRLFCALRSTWVMIVVDNPILWLCGWRGGNLLDDIEGPFYILGSPSVQVSEGKGVLASADFLNKFDPFLFVLEVKDTKGDPVPYAKLDCWHADTSGSYYFASYTLRGKVTADAQGHLEVLTVRPGDYASRTGHLHIVVTGTEGKHKPMTTQAYVCPGNDPERMSGDISNHYRPRPDNGMVSCRAMPSANGGKEYLKFPALSAQEADLAKSVGYWNGKLKDHGVEREVMAVARHTITLTAF
ncbi:aromatic compound dioxygenase [Lentinus tigrinus ALCF2SS1-7]|uniref:Aromatic compound dioxygenase n=1 Tax=Lentinus tigrinus ALCF2SS1-6 TaxID=1328759 RepID=A0A5C2SWZ5_9APHY|nr:aromatic compound dioxygenase [Lentinus tigrinus ALCF2SS1-6]RPD81376.1 aromatic compound dioxygenase [Lentinus tigrinus ALCF2SS1-7]